MKKIKGVFELLAKGAIHFSIVVILVAVKFFIFYVYSL